MCLKSNTAFLSLSYPQSTVVTGLFRQRNYSIYPKVANFADKKCSLTNIVSTLAMSVTRNSVQYLYLLHIFRLVVTISHCKTAFCALWLNFSAISHVGKAFTCVFKKCSF